MKRRCATAGERNAIAVYLSSRGAHDLAISELKKALRLAPLSPIIHYNLGAAYFEKKELDQALSSLKAALDLEPQHVKAHLLLGFVLEAKGLYEESQRELRWVVRHDPLSRSGQEAKDALAGLELKITARQREIPNERQDPDGRCDPQGSGDPAEQPQAHG